MRRFRYFPLIGVFLLGGCAVGMEQFDAIMVAKVKTKAAFDFECQKDAIQVTKIDNGSYGATGCGKRATYVGKDNICSAANTEGHLMDYCQVVPDTFSDSKSK